MVWKVAAPKTLGLAPADHVWSKWDAWDRVLQLAKKDGDGDELDPEIMRRAFVFYDSDAADVTWMYLLQIGDVIDGQVVIVEEALTEALKEMPRLTMQESPFGSDVRNIPAEVIKEGRELVDFYVEKSINRESEREDAREASLERARMDFNKAHHIGERRDDGSRTVIRRDRSIIRFSITPREDALLAEPTDEGFLRVAKSKLARDGVLIYSDGSEEWGEWRPAEELIKAAATFALVPLTWDHPPEMVTSENIRTYQVGTIGDVTATVEEGVTYIEAPIIITDPGLIRAVVRGDIGELSIGFVARVWEKDGVSPTGEPYSFVQTNLQGNHVAVVEEGRAGPIVRLASIGDAWEKIQETKDMALATRKKTDQEQMPVAPAAPAPAPAAPAEPAPAPAAQASELETVEVPGVGPVQMSTMLASIVKALLGEISQLKGAQAQAQPQEQMPAAPAPAPAAESADGSDEEQEDAKNEEDKEDMAKDSAEVERLRGMVDGLEQKIASMTSTEHERFDARVRLVTDARRVLGDDANLDGLTETQIMSKVIVAVDGDGAKDQIKDASVEYVRGRYHAAMTNWRRESNRNDHVEAIGDFDYVNDGSDNPPSISEMYDSSQKAMATNWKKRSA